MRIREGLELRSQSIDTRGKSKTQLAAGFFDAAVSAFDRRTIE